MTNVIVVSPDRDLEIDYLTEFQRTKKVEQNLFYTTEGAETFYTYRDADLEQIKWEDEYAFLARQYFWRMDKNITFVSLGCGNAGPEKMLLHHAHAEGYHITYFGVDSSSSMLQLADANLAQESFDRNFVLADFSTAPFRQKLHELIAGDDVCIYAMLGGTFGNFDQRAIAGILDRTVGVGDYVYLDVVPRYASDAQNQQLRNRLSQLPRNLDRFFAHLLEKLCIPQESGELFGEETSEQALDAWRYAFFFQAKEELTFPCYGGSLTLVPGECLELMNVRAYNPASLKDFIESQGFVFVDEYIPDVGNLKHLWQRFLFEKQRELG